MALGSQQTNVNNMISDAKKTRNSHFEIKFEITVISILEILSFKINISYLELFLLELYLGSLIANIPFALLFLPMSAAARIG
jgi:hypothetical protein